MAKERDAPTALSSSWGTLEELLLACAVNRHGTKSWDSVAVEVLNRTSTLATLTSQQCKDKFNDLRRRFMPRPHNAAATSSGLVPMVDQLRRLRVEELRREVQRRDLSIETLELKVKRLEEERERSLKEEETDLARDDERPSADTPAEKSAAGYDSADDRENGSFNESNSTSQQQKAGTTTLKERSDPPDEEDDADGKPEPVSKYGSDPVRDHSDPSGERISSYNGNLEDGDRRDEKSPSEEKERKSKSGGGVGESNNELGESVGESKREEKEKEKQNSDVQSSVSLKRKRRRRTGGAAGVAASSSGEEPEGGDEVSPARKRVAAVKSEPLVRILEIIRSHRLGSVFERRLRSQESERYKSLIRQHIDLRTVQLRLDKGVYLSCIPKFYRDLLLLFNNAILFFRESSPENNAARELRSLVLRNMKDRLRKQPPPSKPQPQIPTQTQTQTPQPPSKPPPPPPPTTTTQNVKSEPSSSTKRPASLSKLDKSASTLVSCGKRSISLKAATSEKPSSIKLVNSNSGSKQKQRSVEDKPKANPKKPEALTPKVEEEAEEKKAKPKKAETSAPPKVVVEKEEAEEKKAKPKKAETSAPPPKAVEKEEDEKGVRKARTTMTTTTTKERPGVKGRRNARTAGGNKDGETSKHQYGGNELSSHDALDVKKERKESNTTPTTTTVRKKQGAASFLKRMKQNSDATENDNDNELSSSSSSSLSSSSSDEEDVKVKEDKGKEKKGSNKGARRVQNRDVTRERPITRSSRGRGGGREESSRKGRRGGGRVGRKGDGGGSTAAAAESTGKRGRDEGGAGESGSGGRGRKRGRR